MAIDYQSYKISSTGQVLPEVEYTDDPEEKRMLEKPIGRWGRAWQKWIEEQHPLDKDLHVWHCTWQIVPRWIDEKAKAYYDKLSKEYNLVHKDRPHSDDYFGVCKWEKQKALYIEHKIMEDYVYHTYEEFYKDKK